MTVIKKSLMTLMAIAALGGSMASAADSRSCQGDCLHACHIQYPDNGEQYADCVEACIAGNCSGPPH